MRLNCSFRHLQLATRSFWFLALAPVWASDLDETQKAMPQLAPSYSFGMCGGFQPYCDNFVYSPPNVLTIGKRPFLREVPKDARDCKLEVPSCGQEELVDVCDLERLLLDEHVIAAWPSAGEKLYGSDPRWADGPAFSISAPEKGVLTIGGLCGDYDCRGFDHALREGRVPTVDERERCEKARDDCSEMELSLVDLRDTLLRIMEQSRSSPECVESEDSD